LAASSGCSLWKQVKTVSKVIMPSAQNSNALVVVHITDTAAMSAWHLDIRLFISKLACNLIFIIIVETLML